MKGIQHIQGLCWAENFNNWSDTFHRIYLLINQTQSISCWIWFLLAIPACLLSIILLPASDPSLPPVYPSPTTFKGLVYFFPSSSSMLSLSASFTRLLTTLTRPVLSPGNLAPYHLLSGVGQISWSQIMWGQNLRIYDCLTPQFFIL